MFDIIPSQCILVPFSSRYVQFSFRSLEPIHIKAIALCEIIHGPTKIINVFATADIVQYSVDKQITDLGYQVDVFLNF
jgi:hypothetical protein